MNSQAMKSFEHLEGLSEAIFKRLYQQPATALAVFRRMLPNLAKTFVMAMLFNPDPVPVSSLEAFVRPDQNRLKEEAFGKLRQLYIVTERQGTFALDATFKVELRKALTGGGSPGSFGLPCDTEDKNRVDISFLDRYAAEQWESILHFMVGNETQSSQRPSEGVVRLLLHGKLMEQNRASGTVITQLGFSFLLQEVNSQVWTLLLLYLDMAEQLRMDPVDILHFLFLLGSLELGQDYDMKSLTPTQKGMLEDLRDYATGLTSEIRSLRSPAATLANATPGNDENGFLIIETNYRMYAYTNSPLQIAVLNLFARLISRFPNLVTARITRESIRQAIGKGITAEQIIDYMTANAHPQLRKNSPVLPPTVVDQIRLWQIEGERMKVTSGYLFKEFATNAEFNAVCKYADDIGVLVWIDKNKGMLFVSKHEQIADYIRKRAQSNR
ncbi:RNA polymerase II transcription factor B 52 kDa subunit [Orbilia oligospora]|uniref:RNA polymerase II transcription factor B subunit 2 n=1 Tax=Orbilia oligospora TaxID=2813651 RepID=A0A7C8VJP7_ORBOL|nr:RNA polymerase II transcription factor B 52 kDa subunit [Orbilia oligospora]